MENNISNDVDFVRFYNQFVKPKMNLNLDQLDTETQYIIYTSTPFKVWKFLRREDVRAVMTLFAILIYALLLFQILTCVLTLIPNISKP